MNKEQADAHKVRIGKLRHEIGVGLEISALVNNSIVKSTLEGMLHGLQNEWLGELNRDARDILWQRALGLQEFLRTLGTLVETGKLAAHQLDFEQRMNGENDDQS